MIINRVGLGEADIQGFCQEQGAPVLMEIPLDRKIGEGLARGLSLLEIDPEYNTRLADLWANVLASSQVVML